jgi:hypothetical protein
MFILPTNDYLTLAADARFSASYCLRLLTPGCPSHFHKLVRNSVFRHAPTAFDETKSTVQWNSNGRRPYPEVGGLTRRRESRLSVFPKPRSNPSALSTWPHKKLVEFLTVFNCKEPFNIFSVLGTKAGIAYVFKPPPRRFWRSRGQERLPAVIRKVDGLMWHDCFYGNLA